MSNRPRRSRPAAAAVPRPVLADVLTSRDARTGVPGAAAAASRRADGTLARDVALVLAGAVTVTLVAQVAVPLPGTPVPLTLGTFGVLLVGASLGPARGALAVGLYVLAAGLGAPVLAGWAVGTAATASFGYVLGYLPAALTLGLLARRGADRGVLRTALAACAATALVYATGVPWLMAATGMDLRAALAAGVAPFLVGDAIKALATAALLPASWRLLGGRR